MILSISLALLLAGFLLVVRNNRDIPEIPIYIFAGLLLRAIIGVAETQGVVGAHIIETETMSTLASVGLTILVFYTTSGILLKPEKGSKRAALTTSIGTIALLFIAITAAARFLEFSLLEAMVFGIAGSIGSTMLDAGLVREEAREGHLYGWLTEDMNFLDDVVGVGAVTVIVSSITGYGAVFGLFGFLAAVIIAMKGRKAFSNVINEVTERNNELMLLAGISLLIGAVWLSELAGAASLAGVFVAGLMLVGTDAGFRIRERFASIKDFFTALSFISIAYLLETPPISYLVIAAALILITTIVKPVVGMILYRIQGFDLRTGFMASVQTAQVSEISLLGALIISTWTGNSVFTAVAIAFVVTTVIAEAIEDNEKHIFDYLFSSYELDSEKSDVPETLTNHIIIAGYDWETEGLEAMTDKQVIVADYDLEKIDEAAKNNVPHLLADLYSDEAWERLNVSQADAIVSAISDSGLRDKMNNLKTGAEVITVDAAEEAVDEELRNRLRESLKIEKK